MKSLIKILFLFLIGVGIWFFFFKDEGTKLILVK